MAQQRKNRSRIPEFKTYEEEAEFWDTHSLLEDFPEEFVEDTEIQIAKSLINTLKIEIDAKTIGKLGAAARKQGVDLSTLAATWLRERLEQWEQQEQLQKPD